MVEYLYYQIKLLYLEKISKFWRFADIKEREGKSEPLYEPHIGDRCLAR
jgi:hypothetical protein